MLLLLAGQVEAPSPIFQFAEKLLYQFLTDFKPQLACTKIGLVLGEMG